MNIVSWNVNGLRAVYKKGFTDILKKMNPDVLGVQEIKIGADKIVGENFNFGDYQVFWNSAQRPGYAGTAFFVKSKIKAKHLGRYVWDDEGRVQVLDMGKFFIVNVYFPNSNHELSRLDFKIKFNNRLLRELKKLEIKKPVVIMGDYNVAHQEIDLARPRENVGNPGLHPRERAWMDKFIGSNFVDSFRVLHPDQVKYSWWSYRAMARVRNVGWRLDYVCVSQKLKAKISDAFILNDVTGSDHCPVGIQLVIKN